MLPPNTTTYAAEYVQRHSRLTTFFRLLLIIPHYIMLVVYGLVAGIAVIIAWFALLITAKYPAGLYNFVAGFTRYAARVYGYYYLLTDAYPPFSGAEAPDYPVQLAIGPPLEKYSRLLVLFRIFLLIPVAIVNYVLNIIVGVLVVLSWLIIVIMGRLPEGLHKIMEFGLSYQARAGVYGALLTEAFPAFDGSPSSVAGAGVPPSTPTTPVAPAPPSDLNG